MAVKFQQYLIYGFCMLLSLSVWADSSPASTKAYATWGGSGPDKWASIWLVSRHITPDTAVAIHPEGFRDKAFVYFDIPGASLNRTTQSTSFAQILAAFNLKQASLQTLGDVLHAIDINLWQGGLDDPRAQQFEQAFRVLQTRYGRDSVPAPCYFAFFDRINNYLSLSADQQALQTSESLQPDAKCHTPGLSQHLSSTFVVPEIPIKTLLRSMQSGSRVLFIDVREAEEYEEGHIPGAIHLPIRDLNAKRAQQLPKADVIIPYCVKDFRGYEMAKKLKRQGIHHVALLKPYGYKGWLQQSLPIVQGKARSNPEADKILQRCMQHPRQSCQEEAL